MIVFKVNPKDPEQEAICAAADAIRHGELVIFPTETVYGLASDALNEAAVSRVFEAKKRLESHALPVQVAGITELKLVCSSVSDDVKKLSESFWPGPLTLILPKNENVSDLITGGRGTVGVRVPDHPVALAMLIAIGTPITASSANISGRNPASTAQDAIQQLGDIVSVVLDAGPSKIGVASTVLDMTAAPPRILRKGAISAAELKSVIGEVEDSAQ